MSLVVCRLPKAGLGNQLFPLLKAFVFGHLNKQKVIVTGYHRFILGPYLRGEKSKRKYSGYFTFQKSIIGEQFDKWEANRGKNYISEAPLLVMAERDLDGYIFVYSEMPDYTDLFKDLKTHRQLIKKLFWDILRPSIRKRLNSLPLPVIGVHIRMGDFRKLQDGEDFSKAGQTRTPESYFIDVINNIRSVHGTTLSVTVFSDGYRNEFKQLFLLENVTLSEGNPDIIDLLLLSRSKIIIAATGSTFSYWAGFLSDAPVILHPDHLYEPNRLPFENHPLYEGPMNIHNEVLVKAIKAIPYH